jgi:hypothetical protein
VKRFKLWAGLILILVVAGGVLFAWWNYELRWRPKTIDRHAVEITRSLERAGWVTPGPRGGPKLYMISFRSCPDCIRFKQEEVPKLKAAGVEIREIFVARRDSKGGVTRSTPAERSTVAELWLNRSWPLVERWMAVPPDAWAAPGIRPADGDLAREAVVEAGRTLVDDLTPQLKANGVTFAYPLLVWWTKDGEMRACACEKPQTYRFVRRDLGA